MAGWPDRNYWPQLGKRLAFVGAAPLGPARPPGGPSCCICHPHRVGRGLAGLAGLAGPLPWVDCCRVWAGPGSAGSDGTEATPPLLWGKKPLSRCHAAGGPRPRSAARAARAAMLS